jgi:hypothetical protein
VNNLKNQEILKMVKDSYTNLVQGKSIEEISDLDWIELYSMWNLIYPNSSIQPDKNRVVEDLKNTQQYIRIKR